MSCAKKKHIPKLEETESVKAIRKYSKELYPCGWKTVSLTYHGSGDSCDEFNYSIANAETTIDLDRVPAKDLPPDFDIAGLEKALWDLLPEGFENNEGGDGEIAVDTKTGAVNVRHNTYYMESKFGEWCY
jgi:hypothetical protein